MAGISQRSSEIGAHPDVPEMRERYERIIGGGRAITIDGLVLLAGLFLALSPWIIEDLRLGPPDITVHNLVLGLTVAAIGVALAMRPERAYGLSWVLVPIGAWVILSPWLVQTTSNPRDEIIWTHIIVGAVIALLGLIGAGILMAGRKAKTAAERASRASRVDHGERMATTERVETTERMPTGERYDRGGRVRRPER